MWVDDGMPVIELTLWMVFPAVYDVVSVFFTESLILAQDERWRRA